MQSLASTLQKTAQAPVQTVQPRGKVDIITYTGYHDCKSANKYLDRLLHYQQAMGFLTPNFLSAWFWCRSRSKWLDVTD